MTDPIDDPLLIRHAGAVLLARAMADARVHTLRLFAAMRAALGDKLELPYADEVNPPLWELGHVAWFEEFWIARNTERLRGAAARLEAPRAAPLLARADALYDSTQVAHARRWHLDLPDAPRTLAYLARVRECTSRLLTESANDDEALYFFRLALFHESMHFEAGAMMAQALALDVGATLPAPVAASSALSGEISIPAATLTVGQRGIGFAFDNELGEHEVEMPAFKIDRAPVTWAAYLPFIEAGGYNKPELWSSAGWAWRQRELPDALPRHVSRGDDGALRRAAFGRWLEIDPQQIAVNLGQHEAQAWCVWAGRRLPTEHEWTRAVECADGDFTSGQVWEWTASPFAPWPGFTPHPYREYSVPWFDGRPVLKGGSFATPARMKHPRYRNFFPAGRNDVFAGFRSCAR
jgi:gamma-glutamyl hercynylcysteine S-oxide synthase